MTAAISTILLILSIAYYIVIAHVVMSWLFNFGVLDRRNQIVANIWNSLESLLEPIYKPIRNFLPQMGLDLSPIIFLVVLHFLRIFVGNDLAKLLL